MNCCLRLVCSGIVSLWFLLNGGLAAQSAVTQPDGIAIWNLFTSGEYSKYLTHLDSEIGHESPAWLQLNLPKIMAVAIALDKTQQEDSELKTQAEKYITPSPDALRYFHATQQLLKGDTTAITLFFQGAPPLYDVWGRQAEILRHHGYELAANAFAVVYMTGGGGLGGSPVVGSLETGMKALAAIPIDKRQPLEELVAERTKDNWARRQQIAAAALQLSKTSDAASADIYLDIAEGLSPDGQTTSLINAIELFKAGKSNQAIKMAKRAAALAPADMDLQVDVGQFLIAHATVRETDSFFQNTLRGLPEPQLREVRLPYLKWLRSTNNQAGLSDAPQRLDNIVVADNLLIKGNLPQAAQAYKSLLSKPDLTATLRLDALVGLLQASPSSVTSEIETVLAQQIGDKNLAWLGWMLWQNAGQQIGVLPHPSNATGANNTLLIAKTANLLQEIIDKAPLSSLRGDLRTEQRSLRVPAAILWTVAGQSDRATAILQEQIKYEIPAPPGGWRNPPGTPVPADANQPRTFTSPHAGDMERWTQQVSKIVAQYHAAHKDTP